MAQCGAEPRDRSGHAALPPRFREELYYRDVEGLSYEIAALTEIPYGTVVSRLHRGRQRLRHLLGHPIVTTID